MWTKRLADGAKKPRSKASWAAVALAAISCLVQGVNFVRNDLKPVLDGLRENTATMRRIDARLDDHESRIKKLEGRK